MRFRFWRPAPSALRPAPFSTEHLAFQPQLQAPGLWIGVDLDGTLAHHSRFIGPLHIGPPVPAMVSRVRAWLAAGHTVKIFTARANDPACHAPIRAWLARAGLPADLAITATKDYDMVECWDDRAVQVRFNTGLPAPCSISRIETNLRSPPLRAPSHVHPPPSPSIPT